MSGLLRFALVVIISIVVVERFCAHSVADDSEADRQLTLADLAGYRAALSGRPTAAAMQPGAPPQTVNFKDLWNHPDDYRGRRVTVQGRIARIFRQGPVGSFPPLVEVWITSRAGDPFCAVFPQPAAHPEGDREPGIAFRAVVGGLPVPTSEDQPPPASVPSSARLGRTVRFTGTFLKMVRYEASDGGRLAPLLVGDQRPAPLSGEAETDLSSSKERAAAANSAGGRSQINAGIAIACWTIGLVLLGLGAVFLARRHMLAPSPASASRKELSSYVADSRLEFVEPCRIDESLVAGGGSPDLGPSSTDGLQSLIPANGRSSAR